MLTGVRFHQLTRDRNGCLSALCSASFLRCTANVGSISFLASLNCWCRHLAPAEAKLLSALHRPAHRLRTAPFGREIKASRASTSTNQHGGRRSQQVFLSGVLLFLWLSEEIQDGAIQQQVTVSD